MTNQRQNSGSRTALLCGAAIAALSAMPAFAQQIEQVVVTGTSIRGGAPIGSNIIAVDREAIEATGATNVQQMASTVPALSGFGLNSNYPQGERQPTIHNLGISSSLSTLILLNGRPLAPQGTLGATDPGLIPAIAIQRVDVLPDGASAIYGSSAVAGVINFITRRNFDGLQTSIQFGRAQKWQKANFGLLFEFALKP